HVGDHRRTARPRLDHAAVARGVARRHLLGEVVVDERSLLQAARHCLLPPGAARTAPPNDQLVGRLALPAGAALGLTPRRDRVPATGALALAAAQRVVDRVHRDAARVRALALPTVATGLADRDQARLAVADLADGRPAVDRHAAHLRGRETQRREQPFLRDQLDRGTGAAPELGARAGLQLDVVHGRADGDVPQRERVADAYLRTLPALHHVAHLLAGR